ncbi:MAG TPA: hypothetical protein VFW00_13235 [Rhodocyclaceae bacterium]|nr:hypothetical protein [Rhodocyclaceae bacterium]
MCLITLDQVQRATARCLDNHPIVDCVLPIESRPLVDLLGRMIFARLDAVDDEKLADGTITALKQWGEE